MGILIPYFAIPCWYYIASWIICINVVALFSFSLISIQDCSFWRNKIQVGILRTQLNEGDKRKQIDRKLWINKYIQCSNIAIQILFAQFTFLFHVTDRNPGTDITPITAHIMVCISAYILVYFCIILRLNGELLIKHRLSVWIIASSRCHIVSRFITNHRLCGNYDFNYRTNTAHYWCNIQYSQYGAVHIYFLKHGFE